MELIEDIPETTERVSMSALGAEEPPSTDLGP
jgi:hypothetical protein